MPSPRNSTWNHQISAGASSVAETGCWTVSQLPYGSILKVDEELVTGDRRRPTTNFFCTEDMSLACPCSEWAYPENHHATSDSARGNTRSAVHQGAPKTTEAKLLKDTSTILQIHRAEVLRARQASRRVYEVLCVLKGIGIIATRRTSPHSQRRGANSALTAQSNAVYRYLRSNPGVFNTDTLSRECPVPLRRQCDILGVLTTTECNLNPDALDYLDSNWDEDGQSPGSFVGRDGPSCNLNITVTSDHCIELCHPEKTRDPPRASADEHLST
ncbi:hypothetical protein Q5P01_010543 [Channa striata]|uniref:Uncharacterized protein n=1 Tax=Channa striata TaxID=64152 RepID=A0AA88MXX6_CHASR|nr:hypothetical protein Q5P01_010543 [Channa striata]